MNTRKRPLTTVICYMCGMEFEKPLFRHVEAVKFGLREFCSSPCRNQHKTTSIRTVCSCCSKPIVVLKGVFDLSLHKRFFCGQACAASFNNKLRKPYSEATRSKISDSLRVYFAKQIGLSHQVSTRKYRIIEPKMCAICNKEFKPPNDRQMCCSKKCGTIYQFGVAPVTKDECVSIILNHFDTTNRTPMKREVRHGVYHAAVRLFGSWNKAIESCGLKSNGNSPRNVKIKCSDGHVVRSISEKVIDEWLTQNNIRHEIEKPYPVGRYTCDFYLADHNIWVEYFGLAGAFEEYDEAMRVKNEMVKEHGLNLVSLFPKHLYPECKLSQAIIVNALPQ